MKIHFLVCGLLLALAANVQAQDSPDATLDALHKAGAEGNQTAFTALLAEDVIFLGMDGADRLEGPAVRTFISERFARGNAWAYGSSQREIRLAGDGSVAWFDEALENDQLGRGRGTGVLIQEGESWKVAQYNLTLALPNGAMGAQATGTQEKKRCMMGSHKTNTRADC
jgi:SnoaL-like domain